MLDKPRVARAGWPIERYATLPISKPARWLMRSRDCSSIMYSQRPPPPWGGMGKEDMNRHVLNRLECTEGHMRGAERMVDEEPYCITGIKQVIVVQSGTHGALYNFFFRRFIESDQMWIEG